MALDFLAAAAAAVSSASAGSAVPRRPSGSSSSVSYATSSASEDDRAPSPTPSSSPRSPSVLSEDHLRQHDARWVATSTADAKSAEAVKVSMTIHGKRVPPPAHAPPHAPPTHAAEHDRCLGGGGGGGGDGVKVEEARDERHGVHDGRPKAEGGAKEETDDTTTRKVVEVVEGAMTDSEVKDDEPLGGVNGGDGDGDGVVVGDGDGDGDGEEPPPQSKYPGVTWHRRLSKWRAQPRVDGKRQWAGYFKTEEDAWRACLIAKATHHGVAGSLSAPLPVPMPPTSNDPLGAVAATHETAGASAVASAVASVGVSLASAATSAVTDAVTDARMEATHNAGVEREVEGAALSPRNNGGDGDGDGDGDGNGNGNGGSNGDDKASSNRALGAQPAKACWVEGGETTTLANTTNKTPSVSGQRTKPVRGRKRSLDGS
eukprot:CAMPEP_0119525424 /NCGR_PEP_ID=MMETSP1344-20130328/40202_1 /TAXON_ID=236787 /ORGANISM="Florenciella parvula, Strain CCMP2471" /LENGTH=429 /DNA_ID=CAMNT_0007564185 /DNA_START=199 /DNA_END=1485 /DNA_ORIENTATION=-